MKNRIICFMLAALLCAAMLLPELGPAAASGPGSSVITGVDEDLVAGIEFTTAPVFSLEGGAELYGNYSIVSYYNGSCLYIYDQNGKAITNTMFESLQMISDRLFWAKPLGAAGYAIYRDKKPLTNPIYTDFDVQCGCVIAIRDGGRDFFDLDGNRRTVGTLPSGYEARYVTPVGTVVARIRNTSVTSSTGDLFYNYSLLDRNGKVLVTAALVGRNEEDTITASNLENELRIGGALYDCNGNLICPGYKMKLNENRYVGVIRTSAYGEAEKYTCKLYDRTGTFIKELDADNVETVCGDVLVFQKNSRYGLMDQNGTVLVPASYSEYRVGTNSLFTPKTRRVALGGFGTYYIYDDQGNFVAELEGYYGLALYPDSILADTASGRSDLYDLNGTLMKEYQNGEEFKYINGIWFQRTGSSNSWYVVDLCGNRLSEMNFSQIRDGDDFDLYGIARVYQNGWYMVNAAGELLNAEKMDRVPEIYGDNVYHADTEKYLGVYVQNGKAGIFRYIPPIGACEKAEDGKHDWRLSTVITPATCVEGGFGTYRCAACGRTKDRNTPVDANAHAWTLTEVLTEAEEGGLHACTGIYTCTRCNETKEAPLCAAEVFTDMPAEGNWAHDPIDWAYFNGVTSGKTPTTFAPKDTVTRAEAMTFLWKTMNSPEPNAEENPFTDVAEGKYFYKPVLWAVENGVTSGATDTTFAPKQKCTRAQIMMFLWAAAGRPEPETEENPFTDVVEGKYYYSAVLWAVENGVTGGIAPDKFGPNNTCTRAQIVTFLCKAAPLLTADPQPEPKPDPDPTPDPEPTEPDPETP